MVEERYARDHQNQKGIITSVVKVTLKFVRTLATRWLIIHSVEKKKQIMFHIAIYNEFGYFINFFFYIFTKRF